MSTIVETGFELQGESSRIRPMLRDLWRARSLTRTLAKKDFFVRYRRQSIGVLWVVGLPLIQAIVLAIIFSRITRYTTPIKFAVFVFSGILPWGFFSGAVTLATTAIVDGSNLATKVYFPRAVLPLVVVYSSFHGFVPAAGVLVLLAVIMKVHLGVQLLLLVPATVVMLLLSSGFALVLAGMHVYFRDTRYAIQAALLPWFWASGVIYPLNAPGLGSLKRILEFNPAVGMIQLFRASLGAATPGWERMVAITLAWIVLLLVAALPLYRRYDRVFVDLL